MLLTDSLRLLDGYAIRGYNECMRSRYAVRLVAAFYVCLVIGNVLKHRYDVALMESAVVLIALWRASTIEAESQSLSMFPAPDSRRNQPLG
jgi:hypothetical protein